MIIKRKQKKIHPRDLYFVSPLDNLDGEFLYPSIPNNVLTRNKWEDWKTKRISLFPSISGALMYLSSQGTNLKGKTLTVYSPVSGSMESLMKPGIQDSPVSEGTGEYWYLSGIKLREIAKIEVLSKKKGEKIIYHYGPRSITGYLEEWEWREILKPWEKEGKLKEKEFGVVSDLIHSGLPRTYKKYVGRARRDLGNKIENSIERDTKRLENIRNTPRKFIHNRKSGETLNKVAKNEGIKINTGSDREILNTIMSNEKVNLSGRADFTLPSKKVKDKIEETIEEVYKTINPGKTPSKKEIKHIIDNEADEFIRGAYNDSKSYRAIVQLGDRAVGESPEILAHEIGHNISNKSLVGKLIDKASVNNFKNYDPKKNDNSGKGIMTGIKNYIKQKAVVSNESRANKEGLKLLKKDLSPEEIKSAEENMNRSLDKYRNDGKLFYKKPLWRSIQIPSRVKN